MLLRNNIDGRKRLIDYDDTPRTIEYRDNLIKINSEFARHWFDLRIKDTEVSNLAARLERDKTKLPIDLSKRFLYRIFTQGSFKKGGRFYRGWWQNVPSEYRPFITIDGKATIERDYSQLNPNMIYTVYNKELGSEDAYSRVAGEEHRDVVKQAFNAMFQYDKILDRKPDGIELDEIGMSWRELKEAIRTLSCLISTPLELGRRKSGQTQFVFLKCSFVCVLTSSSFFYWFLSCTGRWYTHSTA